MADAKRKIEFQRIAERIIRDADFTRGKVVLGPAGHWPGVARELEYLTTNALQDAFEQGVKEGIRQAEEQRKCEG